MAINKDIKKRLTDAYNALGYNTADKFVAAELAAYSTGLSLISSGVEYALNEINPYTAKNEGIRYYCELLNINSDLSPASIRLMLNKKMETGYGSYQFGEIMRELLAISRSLRLVISNKTAEFTSLYDTCCDILPQIGTLIESYILPPISVSSTGSGCTFEFWDATPYCFEEYDSFNCPFSLLETIIPTNQ